MCQDFIHDYENQVVACAEKFPDDFKLTYKMPEFGHTPPSVNLTTKVIEMLNEDAVCPKQNNGKIVETNGQNN